MANILVIEDEAILARNICDSLVLAGHTAVSVATGEEGVEEAKSGRPDLVLTDFRLPGIDGLEVLRDLRRNGMTAALIVMTAHGEIGTAVEAMKAGAADFLAKPLDLGELQIVIERTLAYQRATEELNYFRERERADSGFDHILGQSEPMQHVKAFIGRITSTAALLADDPPSVLLTGETGTGKDLVARAIHYGGPRRDGKFVHVNCSAIPDHLAESEFFGHVKGAFTGAKSDKRGLFELADRGTLFLDEIGHTPLLLQAKLLHVLEQRRVRPVGGMHERKVSVHVIAATNRNLAEAIETGDFREDLYHRLRVLTLHMPALRERGGDVEHLAHHFLRQSAIRFGVHLDAFDADALDAIRRYDWPGNVRELMHTIESAALVADGPMIRLDHLNLKLPDHACAVSIEVEPTRHTISLSFGDDCPKLDDIENQVILAALEYSKHNVSRASRILGISRDAIRYRLDKYAKRKSAETGRR